MSVYNTYAYKFEEEEEEEEIFICIVCRANDKGFVFKVQGIHLNICKDCWCNVSDLECYISDLDCSHILPKKNDGCR